MERVLVGVDGSDHSRAALRWAAELARRAGSRIVALAVAPYPDVVGVPGAFFPVEREEDVLERTEATLAKVVAEVLGELPGVEVEQKVVMGTPAALLLEAAQDADLLVVGSRGLGGFRGLLLGSVSHQCVTHAPCPVMVVPHPRQEP